MSETNDDKPEITPDEPPGAANGQEQAGAGSGEPVEAAAEGLAEAPQSELELLREELELTRAELEQARAQAESAREDLLRASAEMENIRRRARRDVEDAHRYGVQKLIDEFFPVQESLEGGAQAAADGADPQQLREGMDLTLQLFLSAMEKCGVQGVDPQGERFNPELHEAIGTEAGTEAAPGTVLKVVRKGYMLNDRLVRAPLVVVAS